MGNCEHLVAACAHAADALTRRCSDLRILATSREPLGVGGETTWPVPPLAPAEAEQLFVERARAALPSFRLAPDTRASVSAVCRRLDGLPLAIELAAARTRALSVAQIAARLDDRFRLLTTGPRTAPTRQQTLRATLDWSYGLLSPEERTLLQRLSVFAGGWSLDAAEAVCSGGDVDRRDVLGVLGRLVDRSLVVAESQAGEEMRYRLLETVRADASDRLAAQGDDQPLRRRHLAFMLELVERAESELWGPRQGTWLDRLEQEHDNLRAALTASLEAGPVEAAARLCGALWRFWATRGHLSEGRTRTAETLERAGSAPAAARARALNAAAWLALLQADYAEAAERAGASLVLRRTAADAAGVAESLAALASVARHRAEYGRARRLIERALALYRGTADGVGVADALNILGMVLDAQGDARRAFDCYGESLALRRQLRDVRGIASTLANLGDRLMADGDTDQATRYYEESLELRRRVGDSRGVAMVLALMGDAAGHQGELARAEALYREGLALATLLGARRQIAACLAGLAGLGRPEAAEPEP